MIFSDDGNTLTVHVGGSETRVVFCEKNNLLDIPDGRISVSVFDSNTGSLFSGKKGNHIVLPPGEEAKTFESVESLLSEGIASGLARDGLFIGAGGGVICDMTAFAASIYMRGCSVILVPTTLLAMIDASLGGKTGVDYRGYKNMAGTFYPAEEIRICPEILTSLPEREYLSGLAEVIKHAFLQDTGLLELLIERREAILAREPEVLKKMILDSLKVKALYVEKDFREQGERAFLNLGHTFGHALETVTGFSGWSHGEGVAWGMDKAMKAGVLMGETDPAYARQVSDLLSEYGYRLNAPEAGIKNLVSAMQKDKKKRKGKVRFVLQRNLGETFQTEIPADIIEKALS